MVPTARLSPKRLEEIRSFIVGHIVRESYGVNETKMKLIAETRLGWVIVRSQLMYDLCCDISELVFAIDSAVLNVSECLRQLLRYEPSLYLMKSFYRDHFRHACRVATLGTRILEWLDTQPRLKDVFAHAIAEWYPNSLPHMSEMRSSARTAFWIAALLHDIGYPYTWLDILEEDLSFFEDSYAIKDIINPAIHSALDDCRNELQSQGESQFHLRLKKELNHGIISALYVLGRTSEYGSQEPIMKAAARTIAKHACQVPVDFSEDPLSFLLILTDECQEWQRPIIASNAIAAWIMRSVIMGEGTTPDTVAFRKLESIELKLDPSRLEIVIDYNESGYGELDVLWAILLKNHNLSRISDTHRLLDARIRILYRNIEKSFERLGSYGVRVGSPDLVNWVRSQNFPNSHTLIYRVGQMPKVGDSVTTHMKDYAGEHTSKDFLSFVVETLKRLVAPK
jgi:hypothetical protein